MKTKLNDIATLFLGCLYILLHLGAAFLLILNLFKPGKAADMPCITVAAAMAALSLAYFGFRILCGKTILQDNLSV